MEASHKWRRTMGGKSCFRHFTLYKMATKNNKKTLQSYGHLYNLSRYSKTKTSLICHKVRKNGGTKNSFLLYSVCSGPCKKGYPRARMYEDKEWLELVFFGSLIIYQRIDACGGG